MKRIRIKGLFWKVILPLVIAIAIIWRGREAHYLESIKSKEPIDEKYMYYIDGSDTLPVMAITSLSDRENLFKFYRRKGDSGIFWEEYHTQFDGMPNKKTKILKYVDDSLAIIKVADKVPGNMDPVSAYYVPTFTLHENLP